MSSLRALAFLPHKMQSTEGFWHLKGLNVKWPDSHFTFRRATRIAFTDSPPSPLFPGGFQPSEYKHGDAVSYTCAESPRPVEVSYVYKQITSTQYTLIVADYCPICDGEEKSRSNRGRTDCYEAGRTHAALAKSMCTCLNARRGIAPLVSWVGVTWAHSRYYGGPLESAYLKLDE